MKRGANPFLIALSVVFLICGIVTLAQPEPNGVEIIERSGLLLDAKGSKGPRGLHNNTTLIILTPNGDQKAFEVKSSLRQTDISRIRNTARANKGKQIIYKTRSERFPKLISAETLDGTVIVSAEHTRSASLFTGWSMVVCAILLGGLGLNRLRSKPKKDEREIVQ